MATELQLPLTHSDLIELTAGTRVSITGTIVAAGPDAHQQLEAGAPMPPDLPDSTLLFHCRPELVRKGRKWVARSIEPETSAAYEPSISRWLSNPAIRGFLGYGGFGPDAHQYFRRFTGCYMQVYAGAGPALAEHVVEARELSFGTGLKGPDAMWALDVAGFPAIVTMDLQGGSLHQMVQDGSSRRLSTFRD